MQDAQQNLGKLIGSGISNYPFKHILVEDFLDSRELNLLQSDLDLLEKTPESKRYVSDHGDKREWKEFPRELPHLTKFLNLLSSEEFVSNLKKIFNIPEDINILSDPTYDGGGYVISPPGSFLRYHADFNYSSKAEKYRVLNILFYLNEDYQDDHGGELHLLDSQTKTVEKRVAPKANTLLGFLTDDISFHGVSIIRKRPRRSFNIYYYSDKPISEDQATIPHKTIWVGENAHDD